MIKSLLLGSILIFGCVPEESPAKQTMRDLIESRSWNACAKDDDCGRIGERDQCSMVPVAVVHSEKAYEELKKDWKPRCFGPNRICLPKCRKSKCICEDGGKAPD